MSITITFTVTDPLLIRSMSDMQPIAMLVSEEIRKRKLYREYIQRFELTVDERGRDFSIIFRGMCALETDEKNFIVRELTAILHEMGLSKVIFINVLEVQSLADDIVFTSKIYESELTSSQRLVEVCQTKSDDIPEEYICAISSQLMDEPVYFKGNPEVKFDYNKIRFWLYKQSVPHHPHTRVRVMDSDVIHDFELKVKINAFKSELIYNVYVNKHKCSQQLSGLSDPDSPVMRMGIAHEQLENRLNFLVKNKDSYPGLFEAIKLRRYSQALRRACTCDDYNLAFKISSTILDYDRVLSININEQVGNDNRAAIHYAMKKTNLPLVKFLVCKGADTTLKDSHGQCADDFFLRVEGAVFTGM